MATQQARDLEMVLGQANRLSDNLVREAVLRQRQEEEERRREVEAEALRLRRRESRQRRREASRGLDLRERELEGRELDRAFERERAMKRDADERRKVLMGFEKEDRDTLEREFQRDLKELEMLMKGENASKAPRGRIKSRLMNPQNGMVMEFDGAPETLDAYLRSFQENNGYALVPYEEKKGEAETFRPITVQVELDPEGKNKMTQRFTPEEFEKWKQTPMGRAATGGGGAVGASGQASMGPGGAGGGVPPGQVPAGGGQQGVAFRSPDEVRNAVRLGRITREEGLAILRQQFGME